MVFLKSIVGNFFDLFYEMSFYIVLGLTIAGILHLVLTKEFIARQTGKNNFSSIIKSLLIGIPMPICSCSVIPAAVYLSRNGASASALTAFLIATPQTGADSILATFGMLGSGFAIFRPIAALITGLVGGISSILLKAEPEAVKKSADCQCTQSKKTALRESLGYAFNTLFSDMATPFLSGLVIGALIISFLPDNLPETFPLLQGISGMLLILLLSTPMYICATSSIPVAISLIAAGFSPGTAFVFLTAGPATNIASILVIFKTLGKKITLIYLLTIIIISIVMGIMIDQLPKEWFTPPRMIKNHHFHKQGLNISSVISAALMLFLYINFFYRKVKNRVLQESHSE